MATKQTEDKRLVLTKGQYEALKKLHPALINAVQTADKLVISDAGDNGSQGSGGQNGASGRATLPNWDAAAVAQSNLGRYESQIESQLLQGLGGQITQRFLEENQLGDGSYLSAPNPNGDYTTADELKRNWLSNSFQAGLTNLSHAPARFFYHIFLGGDYDPANAANGVDKFFRQALTEQDWVNEKAQASLSTIDDSTLGGKAKKYLVAPLAYNAPSLIQDVGITVASGGAAAPALAANRWSSSALAADAGKLAAQGAAKAESKALAGIVGKETIVNGSKQIGRTVIEDINHIARQPVTIQRAANYFMESFNEQVDNGVDPKLAWARSLNYAIPASVIDGIGMSTATAEQIPFLRNNINYWLTAESKRFVAGRIEGLAKKTINDRVKYRTIDNI